MLDLSVKCFELLHYSVHESRHAQLRSSVRASRARSPYARLRLAGDDGFQTFYAHFSGAVIKYLVFLFSCSLLTSPALAVDESPLYGVYSPTNQDQIYLAENGGAAGSSRRSGTAKMVLGIIFTPITGVMTLISGLLLMDGQSYNCDWARNIEDNTADKKHSQDLKENRENCYQEKKSYVATWGAVTAVSAFGLAASVYGIISGASARRASADDSSSRFDLVYDNDKSINVTWSVPN